MKPPVHRRGAARATRLATASLAVTLSLTLAACDGTKGEDSPADRPQSQPVEGGAKLAAIWPLTGQPVRGATPRHPVIVTKIDNTASSRPQLGLNKADLVTEELVEGGSTRLAVFFYQRLPAVAGPVRSMRASDIGIVKPALAVVATSGAAPPTLARMRAAEVPYYEEGAPGFYRAGYPRRMPYNLMVKLPVLAKAAAKKAVVPASYLPWGSEEDFTGTRPATSIDAVFSRDHTTSWTYAKGTYANTNSFADPKGRFNPDSVLVIRVRQGDAGYLDPAGNRVPETLYTGSGSFLLFHKGKVMRGTWTKKNRETPVSLSTRSGSVKVPAGHVWIELLPVDKAGGRIAFRK